MLRTVMLLTTLGAIFLVIGFLLGGFLGIGFALLIAIFLDFSAYWWSDKWVLRLYNAREFKDEKLEKMLDELSSKAGIPRPRLYLIRTKNPNAFATGRNPKNSAVAVTEGLLELEDDEIEGVLGHEIMHIKNRDCLLSAITAVFATAIAFLAQIGYWSLFADRERMNPFAILLIVIFAPLAASLIRLAISREREYLADQGSAYLTRKPEALASALRKIAERSIRHPLKGSAATSHLWIVNPFKQDWFTQLFSTHPPLEKRIARLEAIKV